MIRLGKGSLPRTLVLLLALLFIVFYPLPLDFTIKRTRCLNTTNATSEPQEVTRIFFLKTHKCASTTLQNIFQRFGLKRALDFALPWRANYLGNAFHIREWMIGKEHKTVDRRYDLLVHHTRYSRKFADELMRKGTKYVTMLREPASQFESMFKFYRMDVLNNVSLESLASEPEAYKKIHKKRISTRIGFNQMSWDLGMGDEYFDSKPHVERFIKKLDREFDLVLLFEHFEASLVIMADMFNWSLEDVAFVRSNWREKAKRVSLNEKQKERLRELNWADTQLYRHFEAKFHKLLLKYGYERLERDIRRLLTISEAIRRRCVSNKTRQGGYGKALIFTLKEGAARDCPYYIMEDDEITTIMRRVQHERLDKARLMDYVAAWSDKEL